MEWWNWYWGRRDRNDVGDERGDEIDFGEEMDKIDIGDETTFEQTNLLMMGTQTRKRKEVCKDTLENQVVHTTNSN